MSARGPVGHTCPIIDDCIRYCERAIADPDEVACLDDLIGRYGLLEKIRDANAALRDWGAEQEDLANDSVAEVSRLEDELASAKDVLAQLRKELEEVCAS